MIKLIIAIAVIASISIPVIVASMIDTQRQHFDTIPQDALMERTGKHWIAQYEDEDEFVQIMTFMKEYTQFPAEGLTAIAQKGVIRAMNFETIIGERGINLPLVALLAAKQQAEGDYHPTEAELRYHQWLLEKYPVPSSKSAIEDKINDLIRDSKNYPLAWELYEGFKVSANNGNVPTELIQFDTRFWIKQGAVAGCSLAPDCDPIDLAENFDRIRTLTPEEFRAKMEGNYENALPEQSFNFSDTVLPEAYVDQTPINHDVYIAISADP